VSYWQAPAMWEGETAFIVAGGPSLIGFDFEKLKGKRVIAINTSYEKVPFADVLLFGDERWWNWRRDHARNFAGLIVHCGGLHDMRLKRMKPAPPPGLKLDRDSLCFRHTSLTAAINLAVHFGVKRIALLGADMQKDAEGRSHHHKPHPVPSRQGCWDLQMKDLETLVKPLLLAGIEVINTSLQSRLGFWPKRDVMELL
jgi:hypothetical protein